MRCGAGYVVAVLADYCVFNDGLSEGRLQPAHRDVEIRRMVLRDVSRGGAERGRREEKKETEEDSGNRGHHSNQREEIHVWGRPVHVSSDQLV
jgi:hypothetical protein